MKKLLILGIVLVIGAFAIDAIGEQLSITIFIRDGRHQCPDLVWHCA